MKEILYGWLNIKRIVFYECSSFCYGVSWLSVSNIVLCLYFAPEARVLINWHQSDRSCLCCCLDLANRRAVDAALCLTSSILKKAWMSLVDVFRGKCLMHLRALVCRVWMLVAIFWHGERVGMKAQSIRDLICELKMIRLRSLEFLSFKLVIFLISLVLDRIFSLRCMRCCLYDNFGSNLMPRNVGNGLMGIWVFLF